MKKAGCMIFMVVAVLFSCKTQEHVETPVPVVASGLTGTWNWVSTAGGFAGQLATPASTGKSVTLSFTDDLKYFRIENATVVAQGTYQLAKKRCIHTGGDKVLIDFQADAEQDLVIESQDDGTLILSDEMYDGYSILFKRAVTPQD